MSIDRNVIIGPYAKATTEIITVVEPACSRPQTSIEEVILFKNLKGISISEAQILVQRATDCKMKANDQFCSGCGMNRKTFDKPKTVQKQKSYFDQDDDLCRNSGSPIYQHDGKYYQYFCYYPNHMGFLISVSEYESQTIDFASLEPEKEIEKFKAHYEKKLALLKQAFFDNVSFHYGLIQYFS